MADSDQGGSPEKPEAEPQPSPETPATTQEPAAPRPSTRKSGRPPARRGGKLGRNQYTRDRELNGTTETNHVNSPRRGQSHDTGGDSPRVRSNGEVKPSRPRQINPQRTTMAEMKRRVAGILEFISRMQVEMAVSGESTTPNGNANGNGNGNGALLKSMVDQIEKATDESTGKEGEDKDFKDLSSVEMMDVLTRHLLKWQQEYGKAGER